MTTRNPFEPSNSRAGRGKITLALLPPSTPVLQDVSYQYPLKLIAPSASTVDAEDGAQSEPREQTVFTVFMLTYGGGLVAGDAIDLHIDLAPTTRLILLTQGSTKIFKTAERSLVTRQLMTVDINPNATLCYLPDPVQPFESSCFEQQQIFNISDRTANLCACDWVCEGRSARGEKWSFHRYVSRNEVYLKVPGKSPRLLLRDSMILDANGPFNPNIAERMHACGVFGTLILHGPVFQALGEHFMQEFGLLPRIGAKNWDAQGDSTAQTAETTNRLTRLLHETRDGVVWTAAATRGFVVVKFAAREAEGGKRWLRHMLKADGTVERELGERALLCLR